MEDFSGQLKNVPGRILLDTCILNLLQDEGEYIWQGILPEGVGESEIDPELIALHEILFVNQRASFQFVISPLSIAEIANIQSYGLREQRIRWILDVLDHWLIYLDDLSDRKKQGGSVSHRFKLSPELQDLESQLMQISDFKRDPFDRLLLIQYKMANCDAFMTVDLNTIWKHRNVLQKMGFVVLRPSDFWEIIKPWMRIWV